MKVKYIYIEHSYRGQNKIAFDVKKGLCTQSSIGVLANVPDMVLCFYLVMQTYESILFRYFADTFMISRDEISQTELNRIIHYLIFFCLDLTLHTTMEMTQVNIRRIIIIPNSVPVVTAMASLQSLPTFFLNKLLTLKNPIIYTVEFPLNFLI